MAGAGVTGRYSVREEECRSRRCLGVSNASTTSSKEEVYDGTSHRGHAPPLKFHKPQMLMNSGLLAVCSLIDGSEKLPRVSLVCMCNAH
jgi:hypothetical protein